MQTNLTAAIPDDALTRLARLACLAIVRLFYREIRVSGLENLPTTGPVILLANHPNGMLDPVILRIAADRPVGFLAKSTLFGNPFGRLGLAAFAGLPVFRPRDGADTSHNERTFELARQRLADHQWLALFPEGTSHSDPAMRPLKTGAARIALSFCEQHPLERLQLVPCGLLYDAKEVFRSRVAVYIGEALDATQFARDHGSDFGAAQQLTVEINNTLADVVLQADNQTVLRGFVAVAAWTQPAAARDLAAQQALAQQLAQAWRQLSANQPQEALQLQAQASEFAAELQAAGIDDPWQIDAPAPKPLKVLTATLSLLALLPLAVLGTLLTWPMYRAIAPLAIKIAGSETDLISTVKLLLGWLGLPLWWTLQAVTLAVVVHPQVGWAAAILGPLCGFIALRWSERWQRRRQVVRLAWLRGVRTEVALDLRRRRDHLCARVMQALGVVRDS